MQKKKKFPKVEREKILGCGRRKNSLNVEEEKKSLKLKEEKFSKHGRRKSPKNGKRKIPWIWKKKFPKCGREKITKVGREKNSLYMKKEKIPGEKKTNQDTGKYTMSGDVSIIHDN